MSNSTPGPLLTASITTTNSTTTNVTGILLSNYTSLNGASIITMQVSALATSGLAIGSVGAAQVARSFKYNSTTNSATAVTDLIVIGSMGGLVVANIAPLIGDLPMLLCSVTMNAGPTASVNFNVTGLASTNIDWNIAVSCFIP